MALESHEPVSYCTPQKRSLRPPQAPLKPLCCLMVLPGDLKITDSQCIIYT